MLSLARINIEEDDAVIYHYLFGSMYSWFNEKLYVFKNDEVKERVFEKREEVNLYDYRVLLENQKVAIASLRDIDYRNRSAKLFVTLTEKTEDSSIYGEIVDIMWDLAVNQLNLVRVEGHCENSKLKEDGLAILHSRGFRDECIFQDMEFYHGKFRDVIVLAKIAEEKIDGV